MFSDNLNEMGNNPLFQDFICNMVEHIQLKICNDLKTGGVTIDEDIVKAVWYSIISNRTSFELMRNFNLILNGADETAYGNINKFIGQIELIYLEGENKKNEVLGE